MCERGSVALNNGAGEHCMGCEALCSEKAVSAGRGTCIGLVGRWLRRLRIMGDFLLYASHFRLGGRELRLRLVKLGDILGLDLLRFLLELREALL